MDCADVQDELVAYHFASNPQETRDALREHLRSCLACAQSYFDLKADIDAGAGLDVQPSAPCEARLRRDVEGWLLPATQPITRAEPPRPNLGFFAWLVQPMPRYRAALGAAVLCLVAVGAVARLRPLTGIPGGEAGTELQPTPVQGPIRPPSSLGAELPLPYCEVDSARMQALSITYY